MSYTIGIDIGGTNTDLGIVDESGRIVARRRLPTNRYTEPGPYVRDMMQEVNGLMHDISATTVEGIGIGAPNANYYTGYIDNAPNLTIKGRLNLAEEIQRYMAVPVALSNDANAAAYGEYIYGGARGMQHFILFTLGTGVGSGIVIDGKLVHGGSGTAGELGHNILIPDGRLCSCGRKGCLEAYTSARGIVQTYQELRHEAGLSDVAISSKEIGDLARQGDNLALQCWERTGRLLGIAMANAVTFSAPQAIFLMGGPTQVGEPLLRPLRQSFEEHLLHIYAGHCVVLMSQLPANDVAILGAAALVKMKP
ncbi:MAG: glucokinase [bacterium P3]|nr:MAG: glucokinase [bacterium P3]KWW41486.1 MAG: glucokinase [bacterium F083]